MRNKSKIRKIVHVLIGTKYYLALPLRGRYSLIKHILIHNFPANS